MTRWVVVIPILFLMGFTLPTDIFASDAQTKLIDDFSSAKAPHTWQAREPSSKVTYESGAVRLDLPKYDGAKGEAQWPGMIRSAADLHLPRYNGLLLDLSNPTDHPESLAVTLKYAHGHGSILLPPVPPHQRRTLKASFNDVIDGWADVAAVLSIEIFDSRPAVSQTWLLHRFSLYCDDPSQTVAGQDQALLTSAQGLYKQAADLLPAAQKQQAAQTLQRCAAASGQGQSCADDLADLQSQLRLATLAKQINQSLVLWSVPVGTRFEPARALLQYQKPLKTLDLFAAKDQYADRILRLTNLTDSIQDWQLQFTAKTPAILAALSIRRDQPVRAADGSVVGNPLVPLDGDSIVSLAPHQTAELWIRADAKHHDLPAGTHDAQLTLEDLRRGDSSKITLPLGVTVYNFSLADAAPMHLNAWYNVSTQLLAGREQAAMDNLIDYGCDVFVVHPWQIPWPKLNAQGDSTEPMNFTRFDQIVHLYRSRNTNPVILLSLGLDNVSPELQGLKSHLKPYTPQWEKGVRFWISQFMQRMQELDVPTSRYAFYVTDEPTTDELDITRAVAKIARSIDPTVQIYVDGSHLYTDPKLNDDLMSLTNIWQVGGDLMAVDSILPVLKQHPDEQLWVYRCRTSTLVRHQGNGAYDYFRLMSWRALQNGLSGNGYWVYCWDGAAGFGANLVYPGANNTILMSVHWELVRMGLDDVKYARLLQQKLKSDPAAKSQIAPLLGERFDNVLAHPQDPQLAVQWRHDAAAVLESAHDTKGD